MEEQEDTLEIFKGLLVELNSLLELSIKKEEESLKSITENQESILTLIKLMKDEDAGK